MDLIFFLSSLSYFIIHATKTICIWFIFGYSHSVVLNGLICVYPLYMISEFRKNPNFASLVKSYMLISNIYDSIIAVPEILGLFGLPIAVKTVCAFCESIFYADPHVSPNCVVGYYSDNSVNDTFIDISPEFCNNHTFFFDMWDSIVGCLLFIQFIVGVCALVALIYTIDTNMKSECYEIDELDTVELATETCEKLIKKTKINPTKKNINSLL